MNLIGLDVGTTGCKALVLDVSGRIRGQAYREYEVVCTEPAMAEQDAELVWQRTLEVLREAIADSGTTDIAALSLSVQGDAVIPVDRDFHPLHRAILGMDYRSQPQAARCAELLGEFELFQRTGMRPHPMNSVTKVLWLREHRPDVFDRAWKMTTYADYLLGRLGAPAVIDHTMASRTMAFDLQSLRWSPEIHAALHLNPDLWSQPVPSGTVVGTVSQTVAQAVGLTDRMRLVTGGHDQTCAAIGAGLMRETIGLVSTGTAEVLSTAFNQPMLTHGMYEGYYPCYRHAKEGMFFTFALNHVGGLLLKWYRDSFSPPEARQATSTSSDSYRRIDEAMPDGPSSVMVLPHFHGSGTPACDLRSKGAVVGLTLATTRHDIAKAILEGLTFELKTNLRVLEECGVHVGELAAVGGGARSTRWLQLKADILQRPICTLRCRESACLGAALLAGTAIGAYASLEEAAEQTIAIDREYVPHPDRAETYQERYQTYRELYPTLRPIHHAL